MLAPGSPPFSNDIIDIIDTAVTAATDTDTDAADDGSAITVRNRSESYRTV